MAKNLKISLQFSMLSIFLSLFICTMLTIIVVTTMRLYDSMVVISDQQMQQVTTLVNDKLGAHLKTAELSSELSIKLVKSGIIDVNNTQQVLNYTLKLLNSLNNAAMVYWGDSEGNFIISRSESNGTLSSEIIKRSPGSAVSTHLSRDQHFNIINTKETQDVTYDPRQRPWYIAATEAKSTIWSNAYIFFSGEKKTMGITLASPVYNQKNQLLGVFGIDMKLDAISQFLAQQKVGKSGVAFIIDETGKLIAYPNLSEITDGNTSYQIVPVTEIHQDHLAKAFKEHQSLKKNKFKFVSREHTYLASFQAIPSFKGHHWSVAVVIPEDDFIGVLKETTKLTLSLSGIIILLGIILIALFSKQISKQMRRLVYQTDKIKNFDLSASEEIHSHIKEVSTLASGIQSMRSGLKSFQKYVPADLVRQLISQHESAKLGGEKKKIAIFFTDIKDFTSISEAMTPEILMRHLCVYFDHLSRIINAQHGTIDKYIGDAIMAFWGSPLEDTAQSLHACMAALEIQKRLAELNASWQNQNKPMLPTRIGIHTGEAIVGNLGSSERLNYTAIGDTINVGSRLETINKVYGTNIIVSEQVKDEVGDLFFMRELDHITVKGKTESTLIFELVAQKGEKGDRVLEAHCALFSEALSHYQQQNWDHAISLYSTALKSNPNDSVAKLFIERCQLLKQNPPPKDWDGVWRFTQK